MAHYPGHRYASRPRHYRSSTSSPYDYPHLCAAPADTMPCIQYRQNRQPMPAGETAREQGPFSTTQSYAEERTPEKTRC